MCWLIVSSASFIRASNRVNADSVRAKSAANRAINAKEMPSMASGGMLVVCELIKGYSLKTMNTPAQPNNSEAGRQILPLRLSGKLL